MMLIINQSNCDEIHIINQDDHDENTKQSTCNEIHNILSNNYEGDNHDDVQHPR
jgi:hypothetical protein